jgi:hypothetical protein
MSVEMKLDISGALKKNMALKTVPKAAKAQASLWAADTVFMMKESARSMKKSGRTTSQLMRNIGMQVVVGSGSTLIKLGTGTGVGCRKDVKYARIQDEGGIIKAKNIKYLTIPFPGVKGTSDNYRGNSFVFKSKAGNLIIATKTGKGQKLKPLFLLKKQVTIPASQWFTRPLNIRKPALSVMMQPDVIFKVAQGMV